MELLNSEGRSSHTVTSSLPLVAKRFIRKMRGGAQSSLLECSDGNLYIVKMMGNPQGTTVLASELIGGILCTALGFSVPKNCLIEVTSEFIDNTPEMWFETVYGQSCPLSGLQFGSRLIGNAYGPDRAFEYLTSRSQSTVDNRPEFLGLYLFDVWANHHDRRQTLFVRDVSRRSVRATFIDHGSLFGGPTWRFHNNHDQKPYRLKDRAFTVWDTQSAVQWTELFRRVIPSTLGHALDRIPAEWHSSSLQALEAVLLERLNLFESLLSPYINEGNINATNDAQAFLTEKH